MDENKALSMISIAAKAGKVVSGGFMCEKAIQEGDACLIIIAQNAAKNTRKKFIDKCTYYKVPYIIFGQSDVLGNRIGKESRMTLAVTDMGLAKQVANKLDFSMSMEV
ncbi:MAG: 50S ribosomal protein L7ae [Lachnospiraceae bacterium]|nr:50S ribosomal protein L7ae [Lachnospiraceae bacterium]